LDTYIDLAFHEITNYKETLDAVMLARSTEMMIDQLMMVTDEADYHDVLTKDAIDKMQDIIFSFREKVLVSN
jgi:hypothetical protein